VTKNPQYFQTSISWSLSPKTSTRNNEYPSHIFGPPEWLKSLQEPWPLNLFEDRRGGIVEDRRGGMTLRLDPSSSLEVRRGIGGKPPPEEGRRLLGLDRCEFRLLNEALRLLLKVCGRLTSFSPLLLDFGLDEERSDERELLEDRLSNLCSSLDKTSIVECCSFCQEEGYGQASLEPAFENSRSTASGRCRGEVLVW
jgi:hypothetical protein